MRYLLALIVAGLLVTINAVGQWFAVSVPCEPSSCVQPQLTAAGTEQAALLGLSLPAYATITVVLSLIAAGSALALSALVALAGASGARRAIPYVFLLLALLPGAATSPVPFVALVVGAAGPIGLFYLLGTFPSGGFRPRWIAIPVAVAALWTLATLLPVIHEAIDRGEQPWYALVGIVYAVVILVIVAAQTVRFVKGTREERRQIGLVLVALSVLATIGLTSSIYSGNNIESFGIGTLAGSLAASASTILITLVYAALGLSVVRDGAYGARVIINRVLAGAAGLAVAVVVYAIVVALASLLSPAWIPQAIAAIATALALAAVYGRITRSISRLVYGDADDPAQLVASLGEALATAPSAHASVVALAGNLKTRLRFPAVAIEIPDADTVMAGQSAAPLVWTDIDAGAGPSGRVGVALREGQRHLTTRDRDALRAASGPLASAASAIRMTAQLQESRLMVLSTREEERRRVRRELHDDAGPALATISHRIEAARRNARTKPEATETHLDEAATSVQELLVSLRELSRSLRPPALDELGLVRAVQQFARGLDAPTTVIADLDRDLPDLVAITAYRIVLEALTNADRHANATTIAVGLRVDGTTLRIEVRDDGVGLRPDTATGVGMLSMRERAEELGGSAAIESGVDSGTVVRVGLPL